MKIINCAPMLSSASQRPRIPNDKLFKAEMKGSRIKRVLVANRGEIAVRIIRTLHDMDIEAVGIYSDDDSDPVHVRGANIVRRLEGTTLADTYLNEKQIIDIAKDVSADAVIPGYGLLSKSASFAKAVEEAGMIWVGPTPSQMLNLSLKHRARAISQALGVPVLPGSDRLVKSMAHAVEEAERIGYPLVVKSTAATGGIGLRRADDEDCLMEALLHVQKLASANSGNSGVFLERFVENARHVVVPILGSGNGLAITLGHQDCSVRRRNRNVIAETSAGMIPNTICAAMDDAALRIATEARYKNAGTVEFIYDVDTEKFYFLEINTCLQVEHTIAEASMGMDMVRLMMVIARSEDCDELFTAYTPDDDMFQHAMEAKIYAEDPLYSFRPCAGTITDLKLPPSDIRFDTFVEAGTKIHSSFDPLLGKLTVRGRTRDHALKQLAEGLEALQIEGVRTNVEYLRQVVASDIFQEGSYTTSFLDTFDFVTPPSFEVLAAGEHTTIQDYPGRLGYWSVGIPPSGPMDSQSFRLANELLDNDEGCAGLECTVSGPTLRSHCDSCVAVTGGLCEVQIDKKTVPMFEPLEIKRGQELSIGVLKSGYRAYIAIQGGIDVPRTMGSRSTFDLASPRDYQNRKLEAGDVIPLFPSNALESATRKSENSLVPIPLEPKASWKIGVLPGPHGAPDYFCHEGLDELFASSWSVNANSNRLGIHLDGPRFNWRRSGNRAGLHASNIPEMPYSIGSVSFTGDEAVVLTCDGPTLGSFAVFCVVASAEMWKLGQVKPGDEVKFEAISQDYARRMTGMRYHELLSLTPLPLFTPQPMTAGNWNPVLDVLRIRNGQDISIRRSGDCGLVVDFGNSLGFSMRATTVIYGILKHLHRSCAADCEEISAGVCTILIQRDACYTLGPDYTHAYDVMKAIESCTAPLQIPSRLIRLPFIYDDTTTRQAVDQYAATIRPQAPWLPSNVKFLEQFNGIDNLQSMLSEATFLVIGLGGAHLGSPCAIVLDPRHRLIAAKYNPTRSFTPRGTVGIGGEYMCIHATDSPGDYQLVGRTANIWNPSALHFCDRYDRGWVKCLIDNGEAPWLFSLFDRIAFYPVTEAEMENVSMEELIHIEPGVFDLEEYEAEVERNKDEVDAVWKGRMSGRDDFGPLVRELTKQYHGPSEPFPEEASESSGEEIRAVVAGRCTKVVAKVSDKIKKGEPLMYLECGQTETAICSPVDGTCSRMLVSEGSVVDEGDVLVVVERDTS
ncbi:allophanate hydrolase subunit 2-domain-containing protein [Xylariaceae sp. FL1272]|nr:allophanate hydrolase subunit 2-domain-containing protein [Xylariaceae sp. FL1272]